MTTPFRKTTATRGAIPDTFAMNQNHRSMSTFYNNDDTTVCWVYVSLAGDETYTIGYTLEQPEGGSAFGEGNVVWWRSFQGVANAIAYKLLLENVSTGTLEYIISNFCERQNKG